MPSVTAQTTTVSRGDLIISEFRLRGPNGSSDEFIELYNATDQDIIVLDISPDCLVPPSACGLALVDVVDTTNPKFVIPNGTIIRARSYYLAANSQGYSLNGYARPDLTYVPALDSDTSGIALFRTGDRTKFNEANVVDAVGFDGVALPYREGTGLFPISELPGDTTTQSSFLRKLTSFTDGRPRDTNDNATDFVLLSTTGDAFPGLFGGSHQSILGAPGPQNSSHPVSLLVSSLVAALPAEVKDAVTPIAGDPDAAERHSPVIHNNRLGVVESRLDPAVPDTSAPNRGRDKTDVGPNKTLGTLSLRRTYTNITNTPMTRLRFRVVDITTKGSPNTFDGAPQADVRMLDSATVTVLTSSGETIVQGLTVETVPHQSMGGGLNSSLAVSSITMTTPLKPGESVNVQYLLGVEQTGKFRVLVNFEALP